MVSAGSVLGLGIVAIALIVFAGAGGIERTKAFAQQFRPGSDLVESTPSIPKLQTELGTTESSQKAIALTESVKLISTTVADKRKFKPPIQGAVTTTVRGVEFTDRPTLKQIRSLSGLGTAQFSTGGIAVITEAERLRIRSTALTKQEQEDVKALEARRQRALARGIQPNIKLSGAELVLRKREQEAISQAFLTKQFGAGTFVGGKLFANPDFESGGVSTAELERRKQESIDLAKRLERNRILNEQRRVVGVSIQKQIGTTAEEQRVAFAERGVNIIGGNVLNPLALAKLRERGLI